MLNKKYVSQESAIASYNWTDLITSEGYGTFYLARVGSASTAIITPAGVYGGLVESTATQNGSFSKISDIDYDVLVNQPLHVKGSMLATMTLLVRDVATNTNECYLVIRLRKWDGTTETEVANGQTATLIGHGTQDEFGRASAILQSIDQIYKPGEYLRITVELWGREYGSDGGVGYYVDPSSEITVTDSDSNTHATNFIVNIPFKIDL